MTDDRSNRGIALVVVLALLTILAMAVCPGRS